MKVAVTGGNGLVGANLVRLLVDKGYKVKALVHHNANALKGPDIEILKGDILDEKILTRLFTGVDVVFHAAAIISIGGFSYKTIYKANVEGTRQVFYAAKKSGVKTMVHFSSIDALQPPENDKWFSEACIPATRSVSYYKKTKALAQRWLQQQKGNGMKVVVLNPTAIFGPYDFKPSFIGEFMIKVMHKKLPAIVNGGYNWVDVRDVAIAAVSAAEKGKDGENYLVPGHWASLKEMILIIENITNRKLMPPQVPYWLATTGLPFLRAWALFTQSRPLYTAQSLSIIKNSSKNISYEKARKVLNYRPRPFKQTVFDTLAWMENNLAE